jgi:hypothetical protein
MLFALLSLLVLSGCGGEGEVVLSRGPGGAGGWSGAGSAGAGAAGAAGAAGTSPGAGGAGGGGAPGSGGGSGLFPYAAPACGACMGEQCAAQLATCRTSTSCLAITGCLSQCASSTPQCLVACDNTPWQPDEVAAAARACQVARCAAPCAITCGGMLARDEACAACGPEKCCAEAAACGASEACQRLDACALLCAPGDAACAAACAGKFPDGTTQREAWRSCLRQGCGGGCGDGFAAAPP